MNEATYTAEGLRGMIRDIEAIRLVRDLTPAETDHLCELYELLDEVEG